MIGRRFGNYQTLSLLGQGGMGAVYLAEHPEIGRKVAIKIMRGEYNLDPQLRGRFLNEARAANAIHHPNLIEILDFGTTDDGIAYLVMEYLEGESLAARLKRSGRLPLEQLYEFVQQAASALGAAHRKGIIHRDLKPDNLFVVTDEESRRVFIKVLDFGIAKLRMAAQEGSVETNSGVLMGTPVYMSPEQCRGTKELDARSDIYSLGCVIHELATGRPPFFSKGLGELMELHFAAPPPPLRSIDAHLPQALEALVLKCLAKQPGDRFSSMAALLAALQETSGVAHVAPISAPLMIAETVAAPTPQPPIAAPPPIGAPPPASARRKAIGAAIAVSAGVTASYLAYRQGWLGNSSSVGRALRSIAVLPFENVGRVLENEYFSDGIADDIIDRLTRLQGLRVVSRTSTFQFKGKQISPLAIGKTLDVDTLVEGSVQRMNSQLKISARLVSVETGFALWSKNFEREARDIFAIQSEIAASVCQGVHLQVSRSEEKQLSAVSTSSLESYEEFLRGRAALFRRTADDLAVAEGHFKAALKLDPRFALAYCGLANAQALISYYSRAAPRESAERALFAAQAALDLDPDLPEALVALALPTFFYRWDFVRAETLFAQALARNTNYAPGHHWRCGNFMALRRPAEAMVSMERAVSLDPLSAVFRADLAWFQLLQGRQREAERTIDALLATDPGFSRGHHIRGEIWLGAGQVGRALESFRAALDLTGGKNPLYLALTGYAHGVLQQTEKAAACLQSLTNGSAAPAFNVALIHLGQGRLDQFFTLMDRAVDERSPYLPFWPRTAPLFASARKDARFSGLLGRIKPI